ncbi:MAG: KilA-N domain-containing protein [Pirellulales bacterium]|nr:KilA-N domain-containing protein [Pirellulales bacterium]
MTKFNQLTVLNHPVGVKQVLDHDYIRLTDIARFKDAAETDDLIRNWLRNRNTLEFLGLWEKLNNPQFNSIEFDGIKSQSGLNSFTLTPNNGSTAQGP